MRQGWYNEMTTIVVRLEYGWMRNFLLSTANNALTLRRTPDTFYL